MRCPNCDELEDRVVETRTDAEGTLIRRRRECAACSWRYTTYERADASEMVVLKSGGTRERFDAEKLRRGVLAATENLDVNFQDIDALVADVIADLRPRGLQISSKQIGNLVQDRLLVLHPVAFVRFASVFRRFERPEQFGELVRALDDRRIVIKRDGRLQLFDREKIKEGIAWAAKHTSLGEEHVEAITQAVVTEAFEQGNRIPTQVIGALVLGRLRAHDSVAFLRFSSVFERYDHLDRFTDLVEDLRSSAGRDL